METEALEQQKENLSKLGIEGKPETLADRMKLYEGKYSDRLINDMPVIIRIDGKNFSKYTKQFQKPFDMLLIHAMQHCARKVADELQGFRIAYHQSDEISFLVKSSGLTNSEICFGGKVNKINSLVASYMTAYFNEFMKEYSTVKKLAFFDCRCFNVPDADVTNYFLHRARDWKRNSITMFARNHFSHKELEYKNGSTIKLMLLNEKGVDWNNLIDDLKYGTFIHKSLNGYVDNNLEAKHSTIDSFIEENIIPKKENS